MPIRELRAGIRRAGTRATARAFGVPEPTVRRWLSQGVPKRREAALAAWLDVELRDDVPAPKAKPTPRPRGSLPSAVLGMIDTRRTSGSRLTLDFGRGVKLTEETAYRILEWLRSQVSIPGYMAQVVVSGSGDPDMLDASQQTYQQIEKVTTRKGQSKVTKATQFLTSKNHADVRVSITEIADLLDYASGFEFTVKSVSLVYRRKKIL